MLKETETEKNNCLFCDIFIIGSISIEGGGGGGGPTGYAYVKGPGLPGTILLLRAHLNWGPFKYYCRRHFLIGSQNEIEWAQAPWINIIVGDPLKLEAI